MTPPDGGVSTTEMLAAGRHHETYVQINSGRFRMNGDLISKLVVTEKAVSKHINNIFTKLGLYPDDDGNRRVLAVLAYLNA
jgi:hypothetical protein